MPTVVVIPVRSFRLGKTRLAEVVAEARRIELGRSLASHVGGAVATAGLLPMVVTADLDVAAWATSEGFPPLPETAKGLDAAAATGAEWASVSRSPWIVLHADLPLVEPEDIKLLDQLLARGENPIAPSSDGGTTAIGGWGAFNFSFGVGSFHRHLARLPSPRVVATPGLLLDIDSPTDLAAALAHPRGRWLREVLG